MTDLFTDTVTDQSTSNSPTTSTFHASQSKVQVQAQGVRYPLLPYPCIHRPVSHLVSIATRSIEKNFLLIAQLRLNKREVQVHKREVSWDKEGNKTFTSNSNSNSSSRREREKIEETEEECAGDNDSEGICDSDSDNDNGDGNGGAKGGEVEALSVLLLVLWKRIADNPALLGLLYIKAPSNNSNSDGSNKPKSDKCSVLSAIPTLLQLPPLKCHILSKNRAQQCLLIALSSSSRNPLAQSFYSTNDFIFIERFSSPSLSLDNVR